MDEKNVEPLFFQICSQNLLELKRMHPFFAAHI